MYMDWDDVKETYGWALLAAFILGILMFFLAGMNTSGVVRHNAERKEIINENRMWDMLEGKRPLDNSGAAHLARWTKPYLSKDDTAGALLTAFVAPDEFHNDNSIIRTEFIAPSDDRDATTSDGGQISKDFVIKVLRFKDSPGKVQQAVPEVDHSGWMTWRHIWWAFAAPLVLATILLFLAWLVVIVARHVEKQREINRRKAYLESLSPQAREILRIKQTLEAMPSSVEVNKARRKANEAFALATTGWINAEQRATLKQLSRDLGVISESIQEGQRVYEDNS